MNLMWIVYWIDVVGSLHDFFTMMSAILILGLGAGALFCLICSKTPEELWGHLKKVLKVGIPIGLICFTLGTFLPAQKTMYMMAGAYFGQAVAENATTQEMAGKIKTILESKLDKYVQEATEEATTKVTKK